jgi:hypothetical protein
VRALIWWEFGFPSIFSAIGHEEQHRIPGLVPIEIADLHHKGTKGTRRRQGRLTAEDAGRAEEDNHWVARHGLTSCLKPEA